MHTYLGGRSEAYCMPKAEHSASASPYRNSFITDLPTDRDTVVELSACGRARWKIENESFNILKTKGYNLEHNFGHGKKHLSAVLATLNLLAFAFHTVAELTYDLSKPSTRQEPAAASSNGCDPSPS